MRLFFLSVITLVVSTLTTSGQSLAVFDLDTSQFPVMKAKFYAFDGSGQQVRPSASEISVSEDGAARIVLSVTCPTPPPPQAVSSVLVIDVSSSMASRTAGTPNIDLAKGAATAWVQGLPLGQSECAITSFDDRNYLNQDFTTDRARLLAAIASLQPQKGTDYDQGLLLPAAGGLQISKNGKYRRVIVFLTDGVGTLQQLPAIIAEAQRQNCSIFAVTLGISCPQSLRDISTQTGGQWFENVTSIQEAEDVYRVMLQQSQGNVPCEVTWRSEPSCTGNRREVASSWNGRTSHAAYVPPISSLYQLQFNPSTMACRSKPVGQKFDTTLTVTAGNAPVTVSDITSSNPAYDIAPKSFTLGSGQSRTLTVSCTPPDSGYTWTQFNLRSDLCSRSYYVSGGYPGIPPAMADLKLVEPDGGEVYVAGSDTVIRWSGISPADSVQLEFSSDNGITWNVIADKAGDGRHGWRVPNNPSTTCLMRVSMMPSAMNGGDTVLMLTGHKRAINNIAWSPDGSRLATASSDNTTRVWEGVSGALLKVLDHSPGSAVRDVAWSPDGNSLATVDGYLGEGLKIWDPNSGALLRKVPTGHSNVMNNVDWSPDGTKLVTGSNDNTAKIWNAGSLTLLNTLTGHTGYVLDVAWSPDGSKVATSSSDRTAKIWDVSSGTLLSTLGAHTGPVPYVTWSPDGTMIATSGSTDMTARIWNAGSGALLRTLAGHTSVVGNVSWSLDGTRVATASQDSTAKIWDVTNGRVLHTLGGHDGWAQGVDWAPDGERLATSGPPTIRIWDAVSGELLKSVDTLGGLGRVIWSGDGNKVAATTPFNVNAMVHIWRLGDTLQSDQSDSLFAIVAPSPQSHDIDLGRVVVNTAKDSVIQDFVSNGGTYPFNVRDVQITGADASRFSLVSGIPPFDVPASGAHPVEFRFQPASPGVRTAQLLVITQTDTLRQTIRGEGVAPLLAIVEDAIDFGRVTVGQQKDTLRVVTIANIGSATLSITGTSHAGPNDRDFSTLAGGGPFQLLAGETAELDLRFAPSDTGRTSGRLLFEYNGIGSPAVVQLFGEGIAPRFAAVDVVNSTIDFGRVTLGGQKDTVQVVTIANVGNAPLSITDIRHVDPTNSDFITLAGDTPPPVQPGDTVRLDLRFVPSATGVRTGALLFDHAGSGSPATVQLIGEGVAPMVAEAEIAVQEVATFPGEEIVVPIILNQSLNLQQSTATQLTATLRFNATLLDPIGNTPRGIVVGNERVVPLELPVTPQSSNVLTTLRFRAMLGNDTATTLTLENPGAVGGTVAVRAESGRFRLLGVCYDGGVRLLNPAEMVKIVAVRPNPVTDEAEVEIATVEAGRTRVVVMDMLGREAATICDGELPTGRHLLRMNTHDLPTGSYYVMLVTPTIRRTQRLDIVK